MNARRTEISIKLLSINDAPKVRDKLNIFISIQIKHDAYATRKTMLHFHVVAILSDAIDLSTYYCINTLLER